MLQLEKVNLIYDLNKETKTYALKNINLQFEQGKFYGVLGPSGSGKSSLLYTLSALKKPTTGSVYYHNQLINTLPDEQLSKIRKADFGFIFQKHFLISYLTILQNVLVPINSNDPKDQELAITLLTDLGLGNHLHKRPYQLSGGQCQRVAIARALINQPKVIFADEITASLDHESARDAMSVLKKYKKDATLIVVTHDPSILEGADEVITIWDGEVVEASEQE